MRNKLLIFILCLVSLPLFSQNKIEESNPWRTDTLEQAPQDMDNVIEVSIDSLDQLNKKSFDRFKSSHLIGVKYSYNICGAYFTPDISPSYIHTPLNLSLLYTYYHDLWGLMPYFGLQFGVKYGTEGFNSEWGYSEKYDYIEIPLTSQFTYRVNKNLRLLLDVGTYYAYRIKSYKEGGFDALDIRNDYGINAGAGFGLIFGPIELHIQANVKRGFCSVYQPQKLSDEYWLYGYNQQLNFSVGLHYNLY